MSAFDHLDELHPPCPRGCGRTIDDCFEAEDGGDCAGGELWQENRQLKAKVEEQRGQLRDAHNDLLDVRGILSPADGEPVTPLQLVPAVAPAVQWLVVELAAAKAEIERLREQLTDLGLREQWAALYVDGTWTSGEGDTRDEAEEIVAESRSGEPLRLARRWISDWQLPDGTTLEVSGG